MERENIENKEGYPEIKREFFAFRDGLTADVLRKGGLPHKMIFGLQLPQLRQIADSYSTLAPEERSRMARWLWTDRDVRESRLLACYLFDPASMTPDEALSLAADLRSREEADMLAFRVLKRMTEPQRLLETLLKISEGPEAADAYSWATDALRRHLL